MPKTKRLNVGIVGAGLMGHWHANAARRTGAHISAIADKNNEASRRLAGKYFHAKSFSSVEQMLENMEINVLHICTPTDTHVEISEIALESGINLVIEKPVTPTTVETERILKQAASNNVILCAVHQFLFQEGVLKAKGLLNKIGRMIHIESTICSAGADGLAGRQRDLIAADILPHPLSLMQSFVPGGVSSEEWNVVHPEHGDLRISCNMAEVTMSIFISMNARPTECSLKIVGTDGAIHIDLFHGYSFLESGKVSRTRKILHPFSFSASKFFSATVNLSRRIVQRESAYPGLYKMINSFYRSVLTHSKCPISDEDTLAVAIARDKLLQSVGFDKVL
ncbi:MAG: Gfo/Idh/MocA family oxidoreductase [Planctomycetes bacterium]|nr:Gfo/Idh/MocA family oxidoreductase [Planctomycetota bacterium]